MATAIVGIRWPRDARPVRRALRRCVGRRRSPNSSRHCPGSSSTSSTGSTGRSTPTSIRSGSTNNFNLTVDQVTNIASNLAGGILRRPRRHRRRDLRLRHDLGLLVLLLRGLAAHQALHRLVAEAGRSRSCSSRSGTSRSTRPAASSSPRSPWRPCPPSSTAAFFYLIDIPYWLPMGIFAGVVSQFIPTIGTYIGVALPALFGAFDDPIDVLWIILFATVYQQIENYVFTPTRLNQAPWTSTPAWRSRRSSSAPRCSGRSARSSASRSRRSSSPSSRRTASATRSTRTSEATNAESVRVPFAFGRDSDRRLSVRRES